MVSDSDAGALTVCRPWGSGGARGVAWIHDADRYGNAGYALAVSNDRLLLSDAQRTHVLNDAGAVTQTIPHGGASATDSQGNLYLLGKFDGSYDGGTGTVYPTPGGGNAYISKYDSEFQPIYTRVLGTTANVTVSSPSADDRGDVAFVLNEAGAETAVKLAPDGSTSWSSEGPVSAVALDRGGNAALGISNSSSVTVSKVDSAGTLLWTRHFASSGVDLRGVLFDSLGDTVFWGTIQGQIEFGDTTFAMDAGENGPLALIGALSPDGAPRYVRAIDMNYIRRVVADSSGHLIIVGSHDNPFEWRLNRIDESGALMTVRTGDDLLPALPHGLSGDAAIDSAGHVYWQATIVSPAPLSYLIKFLPF
jgi:hypothetical protein